MDVIILHPKTKEEIAFYEYLARQLKTPYMISTEQSAPVRKKPSDFFGSISEEEGTKFQAYINKSREDWERDI